MRGYWCDAEAAEFGVPAAFMLAALWLVAYRHGDTWSEEFQLAENAGIEGVEGDVADDFFAELDDKASAIPVAALAVALGDGEGLDKCSCDCLHNVLLFFVLLFDFYFCLGEGVDER